MSPPRPVLPLPEPSPRPRRPAARAEGGTRERIVAVAEELISVHGMEGLRLKDVARRVGIQPPSIFAHFEGREAIGNAVAHRVLEQLVEVVEGATRGCGSPREAVRQGVRALAGHLYDHPGHARMLLRDLTRTRSGGELAMVSPVLERLERRIGGLLEAGVRQGDFHPVPPRAFMSQIEGAMLASIGWHGFDDDGRPADPIGREAVRDQASDLAMAYLRPR